MTFKLLKRHQITKLQPRHHHGNKTPLIASLFLTAFASTATSVIWNGLPFIGKRDYDFGEKENLSLFLLIGVVYVLGALVSGRVTRWLRLKVSTRSIIGALLCVQTLACSLPLFFNGPWVIWCAGSIAGACSALLWPIVESYLVSARHGKEMRRAIGWWNLVWMSSVAAVMFAMAPMMENHASMVIVGLGAMNIIALSALPWYGKNPGHHDEEQTNENVPAGYRKLLFAARILLPLSYVMNGVLSPLLPYVVSGLDVPIFWQTPIAGAWMVSRVGITAVMWKFSAWHGKWSILWLALLVMTIGFAGVLGAPNVTVLLIGLFLFGIGAGVTYYAGLYYAMSVGKAEVDAGGMHEALIGGGYMIGPIVGLATLQVSAESQTQTFQPIIIVILVFLTLSIGALALFGRKAR